MKITIRGHKHVEEKPEVKMELWLEKFGSDVELKGRDGNGYTWEIARFGPSGFRLYNDISITSGWPLDIRIASSGRLGSLHQEADSEGD